VFHFGSKENLGQEGGKGKERGKALERRGKKKRGFSFPLSLCPRLSLLHKFCCRKSR
jgi:hypothetical protein